MSSHSSTHAHGDLEQLRTQAKELLSAAQANSPEAIERFRTHHPRFRGGAAHSFKLTGAQLVLAREHGYVSWPKLADALRAAKMAAADAFVEAAVMGKLEQARALLEDDPNLTRTSIYAAVVYGDVDALRRWLDGDRGLANTAGGPRRRPPLLYAAFSRFFQDASRRESLLDTVRLLLAVKSDPNAAYREAPYEDYPLTALYGAAGVLHDAELAGILLDAGANPNDNESLYHSVEEAENTCTTLLLERGADPNSTNALAHQLDFEDPEGLRLFLSHGADPNRRAPTGGTVLHWAIMRRRGAACIGLLTEYGADLEARDVNGLTPYGQAVRTGQTETAELLAARGASITLTIEDEVLGALSLGDAERLDALRHEQPNGVTQALAGAEAALTGAAAQGLSEPVRLMLDLGVSVDARGANHATALHWAAWGAHADTVRLLAARGAALEIAGADFGTTPLQWALHGSGNNPDRPQDAFVETIEVLLAAGAQLDSEWLEMASGEVRSKLTEL